MQAKLFLPFHSFKLSCPARVTKLSRSKIQLKLSGLELPKFWSAKEFVDECTKHSPLEVHLQAKKWELNPRVQKVTINNGYCDEDLDVHLETHVDSLDEDFLSCVEKWQDQHTGN